VEVLVPLKVTVAPGPPAPEIVPLRVKLAPAEEKLSPNAWVLLMVAFRLAGV